MYCTRCGNQVKDGINVCSVCGHFLSDSSSESTGYENRTTMNNADPNLNYGGANNFSHVKKSGEFSEDTIFRRIVTIILSWLWPSFGLYLALKSLEKFKDSPNKVTYKVAIALCVYNWATRLAQVTAMGGIMDSLESIFSIF